MESPYIIELKNLTKKYGDKFAVDNISLNVKPGEFLSILGPSGCGKTTTLRMIAGFEYPTDGSIILDGKDSGDLPPNKRPVNTVFQNYALFPHLTIFHNIGFGLKRKGFSKEKIKIEVDKLIETMGLEEHREKYPNQLSGGQQQRVALARALVNQPKVLLLDEPLGALDLKLRKKMQFELKRLHRQVGITFVFVTHDQEEALVMSDRIVVMKKGEIEQVGSPEQIYQNPSSSYVAEFIGDANKLETKIINENTVSVLGNDITLSGKDNHPKDYSFIIRPEHIAIKTDETVHVEKDVYTAPVKVKDITYAGSKQIVEVDYLDQTVFIHCQPDKALKDLTIGQEATILWGKEDLKILK